MTPKNDFYQELKDFIKKSVEEGVDSRELLNTITPYWFRYFNYTTHPLEAFNPETRLTAELINLYVNRHSEIKWISKYIGAVKDLPAALHVAIIGPVGIGKHLTFKITCQILSETHPNINIAFYDLTGFDFLTNEELSDKQLKKLNNDSFDVRILSCPSFLSASFIRNLNKYRENTRLIFSIWALHDYLITGNLQINKEIFFRNYSRQEIIDIFTKRVEAFLIKDQLTEKYKENLKKYVLPEIASYCNGNLKIAFLIFELLHQKALIKNVRVIDGAFIKSILPPLIELKNQRITKKEAEILRIYFSLPGKFITTSHLMEFDIEHSVAWKYLEKMTKKGFFHKTPGNPSKYEINELFLSWYEERIKKETIFRHF
ncbi:MAG: hypothetical protein ACTSYC_02735 [Promethearchaeota archaeon]